MTRGPTIVRVAPGGRGSEKGIKCCCCRCCECLNLGYLTTQHGVIKLAEAMLGGLCQSLLVKYGMAEAGSMGGAFHGFLTTASACLLTTALLIACYVLSSNTQQLIRQSIFECLFNAVACFLYMSASSYMCATANIFLYPKYTVLSMYSAYPAMTAVYECLFNAVACFLYMSASSYMCATANIFLYPKYTVLSMYSAYPAMTAVYECLFNAVACFLYMSASSYMCATANIFLYPKYTVLSMYSAYPAMTAVYYVGVVVGILHGVDAYISYKYHKGYR